MHHKKATTKKLKKARKAPKSTKFRGEESGINTEEKYNTPKSTKSTKKHGSWGVREANTEEIFGALWNSQARLNGGKSTMVVLFGAFSCFVLHAKTYQPQQSTKKHEKHQKARNLRGEESKANTEEKYKAPKCTKSTKKHRNLGGWESPRKRK